MVDLTIGLPYPNDRYNTIADAMKYAGAFLVLAKRIQVRCEYSVKEDKNADEN